MRPRSLKDCRATDDDDDDDDDDEMLKGIFTEFFSRHIYEY
jgi:hypothetical protein